MDNPLLLKGNWSFCTGGVIGDKKINYLSKEEDCPF